ncbi:MAG: hypothetical protein VB102_14385 [Paludibacter sp.]|nr:hypothetical protein [Paludibacter sp.]
MDFCRLKSIQGFTAKTPSKKQTNIAEKIGIAKWEGRDFEINVNQK